MKQDITNATYEIEEGLVMGLCNLYENIEDFVDLAKRKDMASGTFIRKLYKIEHRAKRTLNKIFDEVTGEGEWMRDYNYSDEDDLRLAGYSWKAVYQDIKPYEIEGCLGTLRNLIWELAGIALHDGYVPDLRRQAKESLTEIEAILEALEECTGELKTQEQT